MARSTYIYLAWRRSGSLNTLLGAFTVKHEMMSRVGLKELMPVNSPGWYWTDKENINVQRVRDGQVIQ